MTYAASLARFPRNASVAKHPHYAHLWLQANYAEYSI